MLPSPLVELVEIGGPVASRLTIFHLRGSGDRVRWAIWLTFKVRPGASDKAISVPYSTIGGGQMARATQGKRRST